MKFGKTFGILLSTVLHQVMYKDVWFKHKLNTPYKLYSYHNIIIQECKHTNC